MHLESEEGSSIRTGCTTTALWLLCCTVAQLTHAAAFIVQDTRGRGDSEGKFDFFFTDAEDVYDTIEWITRQSWSNGRIGMMGGSYRATVQWLAEREGAPLTCIFPQAPAARYLDEIPYTAVPSAWNGRLDGSTGRPAA